MKNSTSILFSFLMILSFNSSSLLATNIDLNGSPQTVAYVIPNGSSEYFEYGSQGHDIGRKWDGYNSDEIARTLFSFYISSIPANATIDDVSVTISFSNYYGFYEADITFADFKSGPNNQWYEIGSAATLASEITYGSGIHFNSTALKNDLQNSLGSDEYHLGVYSKNEVSSSTYANVSMELHINYTVPPSDVNITVQNNFIYGTIKVGENQVASQGTSPYPITPTVGNTVNVEAQEQPYGGYNRIWNDTEDTEAPLNKSKWEKIKDGQRSFKEFDISYSFTAAANDDNSTYEAGLRKVCNITFSNQLNQHTVGRLKLPAELGRALQQTLTKL